MKQILTMVLYCTVLMFPFTACSGTLRVEPDPHDPKLHGQVVRFTVPMVYMEFNDEDSMSFDKRTLNTGQLLTTETIAQSLYNRKGKHIIKRVGKNMTFSITESYWVRHDWFTREFAPDLHMIVLIDEDGNVSSCLQEILGYSDKQWLAE